MLVPFFDPSRDWRRLTQKLLWPAKWVRPPRPPTLLISSAASLHHWAILLLTARSFAAHRAWASYVETQHCSMWPRFRGFAEDTGCLPALLHRTFSSCFLEVNLIIPFTFKIYPLKNTFCWLCVCVCVALVLSDSLLIPWTVARHASLSMGFSRQEYWSGLSCPPPGDLPDPSRFFTFWATWEATFAYLPVLCYSYLYGFELPFFFHADPLSVSKF